MRTVIGLLCLPLYTLTATAGSLNVTVSGINPNGTTVAVAVCANGLDFGTCQFGDTRAANAGVMRFSFDVPPGRYAVAAYQDTNRSGSLERSRLGIPLEPYGLSNDAGRSRRPSFETAAFNMGSGDRNVSVRLQSISHAAGTQE